MESGVKRHALAWHRRAGKDDFALHRAAVGAFERVGTYWHMLPKASQARKAIWDAVNPRTGRRRIDDAFPHELRDATREQEMFIRFKNGSTWQVVGSDNFNSLVGAPPIGLVASEYALANPEVWGFLSPILAENGGWAMFISTPRGRNHFWRLVEMAKTSPDWYGEVLTVEDTQSIPMEIVQREHRERAAERGEKEAYAIIRQEYYCDPDAALPGAYYGEHMESAGREGRIGDFPWLSNLPVGTACDLGHGDQTVVWFYQQLDNGKIRVIDVISGCGVGIDWYARRIVNRPYTVVDNIWPHDGDHKNIRDINGTTLKSQAKSLGWAPIRTLDVEPVDTGIQAVRQMMSMVEFNGTPIPMEGETREEAKARMTRALDALRMYRREWDGKRQCFRDAPYHDWTSDYADAFRYLARGRKPFNNRSQGGVRSTRAIMD